jgi:histone H3/H4
MTRDIKKSPFSIPRKNFKSIVKDILKKEYEGKSFIFYKDAYEALQMESEEYLYDLFKKAQNTADLSKRSTILKEYFN